MCSSILEGFRGRPEWHCRYGGVEVRLIWWPFSWAQLFIEVIVWGGYLLVVIGNGLTGSFALKVFDDLTLDAPRFA